MALELSDAGLLRTEAYINGEWVDPIGTETMDVINPATEEPICAIALGNSADVDRAVAAAKAASATGGVIIDIMPK